MSATKAVQILLRQPIRAKGAKTNSRQPTEPEAKFAVAYLSEFGYFKKAIEVFKDIELEDIISAIKLFQTWFSLPKNGMLTSQTIKAMEDPRCGHPDVIREHHVQELRIHQFAEANLAAWRKRDLKYFVEAYVPGLAKMDQDGIFQAGFDGWCKYGQINVSRAKTAREADIILGVGEGQRSNFDGPGGTLAWAYLPDGNDSQLLCRFDIGETWINDPRARGILLLNVCRHEFGHLFGLDHSKVQQALMAPFYNASVDAPQSNDDVPRFQARYGTRTGDLPGGGGGGTGGTGGDGEISITFNGVLRSIFVNGQKVA